MACETIKINGGAAIICGGRRRRCYLCTDVSRYQCDFPIGRYKSGKKKGSVRTCDRHLCNFHAKHGVTNGVDFCPDHFPIAKAAYERRQAEQM